jgi:hypothetical protein
MRFSVGAVVGRIVVGLAIVLLGAIALRLVAAMLGPLLPPGFISAVKAGWELLASSISPGIAGLMALAIVGVAWWVIAGRGRG